MNLNNKELTIDDLSIDLDSKFAYMGTIVNDLYTRIERLELVSSSMGEILIRKKIFTEKQLQKEISNMISEVVEEKKEQREKKDSDIKKNYETWLLTHFKDYAKS